MTAINKAHVNKNSAIVEIATRPDAFTDCQADLSNVAAVKTAIDALTFERMASVTDVQTSENYSNIIKVDADDTGTIFTSADPEVKLTGNWYEIFNPDLLAVLVNKVKVTDGTDIYSGNKIDSLELPKLIARVTSTDPNTNKVKITYLTDSNFTGEIITAFLDANRAGALPNSPFEFTGNRQGTIFHYTDETV